MWRKTRQPHSMFCTGADPNRNFDRYWRRKYTIYDYKTSDKN